MNKLVLFLASAALIAAGALAARPPLEPIIPSSILKTTRPVSFAKLTVKDTLVGVDAADSTVILRALTRNTLSFQVAGDSVRFIIYAWAGSYPSSGATTLVAKDSLAIIASGSYVWSLTLPAAEMLMFRFGAYAGNGKDATWVYNMRLTSDR